MQIGTIIRKYRLEKNLTQEEAARRLCVTAPAVNKWEKGNSMPVITLLSPIARLLDITLDTLLAHTDSLSEEEANRLILAAHEKLKTEPFKTVFLWAKEQLQTYPNSDFLALYMARVLHSHLQMQESDDEALQMYEELLYSGYQNIQATLHDIYYFALKDEAFEKAHQTVEKLRFLAQLFEMGEYHEISPGLELAILEKDSDSLLEIIQQLHGNIESIFGFSKSPLYSHMKLKQPNLEAEYLDGVRQSLLDCLKEEPCSFIREDTRFAALL